jgi:hypothetical protein
VNKPLQPFEQLNAAIRDKDEKFTKREMIAMHLMSAQIASIQTWDEKPLNQLASMAQKAIMGSDILLDKLRSVR